jgi:hypothetical protein
MKKFTLALAFVAAFTFSKANFILVPMDMSQADHLKAYGIAFQSLKAQNTVQWLLNYRGGAFLLTDNDANEALVKATDVTTENLTDAATQSIVSTVLTGTNNMNLVTMNHIPRIAVYAPSYKVQYDNAVKLALNYAGIDYTVIYDREMLTQDLGQYDWIHFDHEDFTGQYNKWQSIYANADWYKNEIAQSEAIAKEFGYAKVSQMKLAVAKKFRSFVENGGQLFAMCVGSDRLDIALAAEGVDIVARADGDPADTAANSKLNFNNTLAFQNFAVDLNPANNMNYSTINVFTAGKVSTDKFTLATVDAKQDLIGAMLVQDHQSAIKEFMGGTTAYKTQYIKPSVQILGSTATDAKFLHGQLGKGYFTFYGGHDPERFENRVGDPDTKLENYKQSAGYRLILNNVLSPAVRDNVLGVANESLINVKTYPNPFVNSFTVEINSEEAKQATLSVYNLNGQVVITDNINSATGLFTRQYNAEGFAAGLYIVEISNAKGTISKTLLARLDQ